MSYRWRNSVVAISCNLSDGTAMDGTGTLVQNNLVLTAAHVVMATLAEGPVRLRWISKDPQFDPDLDEAGFGFHDAVEEGSDRGVAWFCPELDLALVRCTPPSDVQPLGLDLFQDPEDGPDFFAEAYPVIEPEHWQDSVYLVGSASSPQGSKKESRFTYNADVKIRGEHENPPDRELWRGASGAAIVAIRRYQPRIVGVIVTERGHFVGTLDAVPTKEAYDCDEGFRSLVCLQDDKSDRLVDELKSALTRLSDMVAVRSTVLSHMGKYIVSHPGTGRDYICDEKLLDADVQKVLAKLHGLFRSNTIDGVARDAIVGVACALVACTLGRTTASAISATAHTNLSILASDGPMGAEIGMAAFEGRSPEFLSRDKGGAHPRGRYCLQDAPEMGRENLIAIDENDLSRRLGQDAANALSELEGIRPKRLSSFLEQKRELGEPSYYTVNYLEGQQGVSFWETIAEKFKLPHVRLLLCEELDDDEALYGKLREIIPLRGTERRDE